MAPKRARLVQARVELGNKQEQFAERVGVGVRSIRRWEAGEAIPHATIRPRLAAALKLTLAQLNALLVDETIQVAVATPRVEDEPRPAEVDGMRRRELLRLFTRVGALLALPAIDQVYDLDKLATAAERPRHVDREVLDGYRQLNGHLWQVYALNVVKTEVLPLVEQQIDVVAAHLREFHADRIHRQLCEVIADLAQLSGEILLDDARPTDAAHSYTLAADAAHTAGAYDLWACALTRYSYLSLFDRDFTAAAPMLDLAAGLASRGDRSLSTWHWVHSVRAQAFAGLGQLDRTERALDVAQLVRSMSGPVGNGGWLRFDGSRLAEERGGCYVQLGRHDLADATLRQALDEPLSTRRRASVLVDLAVLGVHDRDPDRIVELITPVMTSTRATGSSVIVRRLQNLRPLLNPLSDDPRIRDLDDQLTQLTSPTTTA